jgi:prepilin-type processing-associated H-X9-DG protein
LLASSPQLVERALAPDTPKLASHAGFQRAAATSGSPVAFVLYDHTMVMERFGAMIPPPARAVLQGIGLDQVRTVGLRLGAKGRALVGTIFVHTTGERRGLIRALASAPVDRSLLRFAPRDAALVSLSNLDAGELYDAVTVALTGVAKAAPGGPDIRAVLEEFEAKAELKLRDDVFGALDRGTLITTSGKSLLPALIVSQGLKDGDRFEAGVGKLVAQLDALIKANAGEEAGAQLKTIAFGGRTIRYLATPGVPVPVAPCYARHGGRLIAALSPIHLKDYLVFLDKKEPSILDHSGYRQLEALVPKNATTVSYSDFGEHFVQFYSAFGPLLTLVQAIPRNPIAIDLANMPSARTVRKHMFGSISYTYATEDMIIHETHSPVGFGLMGPVPAGAPALAIAGVGAGMLVPALTRARGQARHVQSKNNLRQISMAMMVYANDHKGELPQDLAVLLQGNLLADAKILVAANDRAPPPKVNGRPCSYVYFLDDQPGLKLKMADLKNPAQLPVLWERRAFHRGMRNVVFADGHVESMHGPQFREAMARLKAFLKAQAAAKQPGHF